MQTLKILNVYLHPDFESFRPAAVMYDQIREGHRVYLFALTRGEATFKSTIEESVVIRMFGDEIPLEFFNEDFDPPLKKLTDELIN